MFVIVEVYDGRLKHPFTCVMTGPSGSGKLTFVRNLLLKQARLIDTAFDYVIIFLDSDTSENNTISTLGRVLTQQMHVVEVKMCTGPEKSCKTGFPWT